MTKRDHSKRKNHLVTRRMLAFLPHHVNNKALMLGFSFLRNLQKVFSGADFSCHREENELAFGHHRESILANGGYVEDQDSYTDMSYGKYKLQYSGCGVIAAYNALCSLGLLRDMGLAELAAEFERDGILRNGKFGTAPAAISDFFMRRGCLVKMTTEETEFDEMGERFRSLVLTVYNDRDDVSRALHIFCIGKGEDGFYAHNAGGNGKAAGPFASVLDALGQYNGGRAKGIVLIGIGREENV